MKIAISSTGEKLTDNVSDVLARCPYFVITEIENNEAKKTEIIKNMSADQLGQAGISVAQLMAEKGVNAVVTKNVGPRALDALKQFNIKIYYGKGVVKDILQDFIKGRLEEFK